MSPQESHLLRRGPIGELKGMGHLVATNAVASDGA